MILSAVDHFNKWRCSCSMGLKIMSPTSLRTSFCGLIATPGYQTSSHLIVLYTYKWRSVLFYSVTSFLEQIAMFFVVSRILGIVLLSLWWCKLALLLIG